MVGFAPATQEEKRIALERAIGSRTLARSGQLRAFLRFVCEAEMRGEVAELTEHIIGVTVLQRPKDYLPSEDSSVRTRAHELRNKLARLYAEELPNDPIRIDIPKGSYVPTYVRTESADDDGQNGELVAPSPAASELRKTNPLWIYAGILLLGIAVGVSLALVAGGRREMRTVDPVVADAWRLLARPDSNVLLCAATPLHLVMGPASHEAYGSPTYPAPPETYPLFRQHRPLEASAKLGMIFTDNVLGVGTMNAVVIATNTLRSFGSTYQVLPERAATIPALRGRNVMLFGAPVDSEAISKTLQDVPLTVDYEPNVKEFVIRDRTTGKIIVPQKDATGDFLDVYGLLTVDNTRDSEYGKLATVVFSGITSAGTHGAAEYFASVKSLHHLLQILAKEGLHGFPASYQVVVKCKFSNMLLLSYEYYSHRVLQKD
jgi:hypothetical protein